jgi:hypothetical protein
MGRLAHTAQTHTLCLQILLTCRNPLAKNLELGSQVSAGSDLNDSQSILELFIRRIPKALTQYWISYVQRCT